jgi:integrase
MLSEDKKAQSIEDSALDALVAQLPSLPPVIRYYDDFSDKLCSINDPKHVRKFDINHGGSVTEIDFDRFPGPYGTLLKHVFLFLLGADLGAQTASGYVLGAKHLNLEDVEALWRAGPSEVTSLWRVLLARELPRDSYLCAKSILRLFCSYRLGGWSLSYSDFLRSSLTLPFLDKYAGIRSGEAFLPIDAQASIVRYLDHMAMMASAASQRERLQYLGLCDAAMLLCAFQFGMRPVQIAMLSFGDVRIRDTSADGLATVHLTFRMVKQRSASAAKPLLRRVKREWSPLFIELARQANDRKLHAVERIFGARSSQDAGRRIAALLRGLIGGESSARDLRHTAAQRLVDAGASQEELAEFLGHTDITTGLVYFDTSANQAERVNKALGISEIYQRVARIAHDRFITADDLIHLKGDQQIAGVPHGIPIAGIGGCSSGQPACPYSPILSCYGCRKFMPVREAATHHQVIADLRKVVLFFNEASRNESASPAYLQLQRTMVEVQTVIQEIEGDTA